MSIEYKEIHEFEAEQLKDLFLSVEWSSGHYPDKLVVKFPDCVFCMGRGKTCRNDLCYG
jgi:hypothetical protein